ncbi:hypothetical protein L873DRAFT_1849263 [Choiromyces venosus 120613-1]|uniref:Uncharacterized protein n=1 Tax=Choiromyces venosus 120613-1 TaxID=1336337 RepID=A0A3N4IYX7_9PEZI|nr:hypothetical protein L873DRAFT_1849263 [Choiromyces venosus 120613-1]
MFDANGDPIVPFASPASPASTPDAPTELASDWDYVSSGLTLQIDAAKNIFRFNHDLPVYGTAFGVEVSTGSLLYEQLVNRINQRGRLNKRCTARKRGTKAERQRKEYLKRRKEDYGLDIEGLVMRYITDLEETMIDVFGPEESCMLCDLNLEMDLEMEELENEFDS